MHNIDLRKVKQRDKNSNLNVIEDLLQEEDLGLGARTYPNLGKE